MNKIFFLLLLLFHSLTSTSQADVWLLPPMSKLVVNGAGVMESQESNNLNLQQEGFVVIPTEDNKILFYGDGKFMYNSYHQLLPGWQNIPLIDNSTSSQQVAIIKYSSSDSLYVMLSLNDHRSRGELFITTIDMSKNGGDGAILPESIKVLGDNLT